jgi:hypothetical protein
VGRLVVPNDVAPAINRQRCRAVRRRPHDPERAPGAAPRPDAGASAAPKDEAGWLRRDLTDPRASRALLRPYPAEVMVVDLVSPAMNTARHD